MNLFSISGLLIGITSFIFGIFVYWQGRKNRSNQIWILFCFSVAIWGFGGCKAGLTTNTLDALFWWKITYIGIILIPLLFYQFIYYFLELKNKKLFYFIYTFSFFFLILEWTPWADLFFGEANMTLFFNSLYFVYPRTLLFTFFVLTWLVIIIFSHYKLFQALRKSSRLKHSQIKYFFLATTVGFIGGGSCFLPCFNIKLYPIFNFTVPLYPAIMTYAILRYRLMDIKVAIRRGAVFSALVVAVITVYILPVFLFGWIFFGGAYTLKSQLVTGLIVAIATAAGFMPLYEWLRKSTDKFLFKGIYNPQELLADVSDSLSRTLDLDKIINVLKVRIIRAMRVSKMSVLILSNGNIKNLKLDKRSPKAKEFARSIKKIVNHCKRHKGVLILEELKRKLADKVEFERGFILIKDIEIIKTDLIMPLYIKKKLVGLFLIGNKKSGDMFSIEDIRTLETIASQSAIAIENARLYEEMKDFSKTLQKEVKKQTRNLRVANEKLKQLDKAKSLFISLASHQLRTPLTAIKGYISMLLEKTWGALKPEQEKRLKRVFLSNERLINLVEDLLALSRIESGRFEFTLKKLSLENVIGDIVQDFNDVIKKKNLYLKFNKPVMPLPQVKADDLKIRQVFQNLIDNAIHYTEKGGITIDVKKSGNKILASVKDTGIGIADEEKDVLFEKFSRGSGANKMFTEGTGLGLYFCSKLVNAHKGKIWVESKGENKGSAFFVELPVAK